MDRALAQIAIPLLGIIVGAAAAAYFKKRVGSAGATLCAALVLLAAAAVSWAYTFATIGTAIALVLSNPAMHVTDWPI